MRVRSETRFRATHITFPTTSAIFCEIGQRSRGGLHCLLARVPSPTPKAVASPPIVAKCRELQQLLPKKLSPMIAMSAPGLHIALPKVHELLEFIADQADQLAIAEARLAACERAVMDMTLSNLRAMYE